MKREKTMDKSTNVFRFSNILKSTRQSVNSVGLILKRWVQVSAALLADIHVALGITLHMQGRAI